MRFHRSPEVPQLTDEQAYSIPCIREMATLLVLAHTGTELDEGIVEDMCNNVASVAEKYNMSPDRVQRILVMHDSTLDFEAVE